MGTFSITHKMTDFDKNYLPCLVKASELSFFLASLFVMMLKMILQSLDYADI